MNVAKAVGLMKMFSRRANPAAGDEDVHFTGTDSVRVAGALGGYLQLRNHLL